VSSIPLSLRGWDGFQETLQSEALLGEKEDNRFLLIKGEGFVSQEGRKNTELFAIELGLGLN